MFLNQDESLHMILQRNLPDLTDKPSEYTVIHRISELDATIPSVGLVTTEAVIIELELQCAHRARWQDERSRWVWYLVT